MLFVVILAPLAAAVVAVAGWQLELRQSGCSTGLTCGTSCIDFSDQCCGNGTSTCSGGQICQLGSDGSWGCCDGGSTCQSGDQATFACANGLACYDGNCIDFDQQCCPDGSSCKKGDICSQSSGGQWGCTCQASICGFSANVGSGGEGDSASPTKSGGGGGGGGGDTTTPGSNTPDTTTIPSSNNDGGVSGSGSGGGGTPTTPNSSDNNNTPTTNGVSSTTESSSTSGPVSTTIVSVVRIDAQPSGPVPQSTGSSASNSGSSENSGSGSSGLNSGGIAGITVGSVAGIVAIVSVALQVLRYCSGGDQRFGRVSQQSNPDMSEQPPQYYNDGSGTQYQGQGQYQTQNQAQYQDQGQYQDWQQTQQPQYPQQQQQNPQQQQQQHPHKPHRPHRPGRLRQSELPSPYGIEVLSITNNGKM